MQNKKGTINKLSGDISLPVAAVSSIVQSMLVCWNKGCSPIKRPCLIIAGTVSKGKKKSGCEFVEVVNKQLSCFYIPVMQICGKLRACML